MVIHEHLYVGWKKWGRKHKRNITKTSCYATPAAMCIIFGVRGTILYGIMFSSILTIL